MKLNKLTRLAAISAVVLTFAMNTQEAQAQCAVAQADVIDAQVAETLDICALIDNTFTSLVTDVDFETIGATSNTGEYGCAIMAASAAGTIDEGNAAPCSATDGIARIVSDDEEGTAGLIAIQAAGAFINQEVRLQFQVPTDTLTCQGTSPPLYIGRLVTDQATTLAVWDADDAAPNTDTIIGAADTDGTGALDIYIGAEIRTDDTSSAPYESGTCAGTFEVTLFY